MKPLDQPEQEHADKVLVAIPTQGRRDLRRLGHSMQRLPNGWRATFFVNGSRTAPQHLEAITAETGVPAVRLPESGYASARNGALSLANSYQWILFFDDDQLPSQGWAEAFDTALRAPESSAHAMIGPRVAVGSPHAFVSAQWTRGSKDLDKFDSDFEGHGYTGNTLIDMQFLQSRHLWFDPQFDVHGGEDTDFFERLRQQGGIVQFIPNALAIEIVDDDRLTPIGVFRSGRVNARRNYLSNPSHRAMLRRILGRALVTVPIGIAAVLTVDRLKLSRSIHSAGMLVQYIQDITRATAKPTQGVAQPIRGRQMAAGADG